jgi:arylsulfatase
MSRHPRGFLFLLVVVSVCRLAAGHESRNSDTSVRPNIVLVITDDQGYPTIGRHGHPWLKTPNLDALYDQSTRFTRFLVSPTCSPTRAALMTGRHDMRNGVTHTILERERLTLDAVTLPQLLVQAGYRTGLFGKWHLGDEDNRQPQQRGFQEAFIHGGGGIGQAYDCSCADAPDNSYFNPFVRQNGKFFRTTGFCTTVFFDAALDWINRNRESDSPFFACIATNAPHAPYYAPPVNRQRFLDCSFGSDEAGFYGMIEHIDEQVGRLLAQLENWKLTDNTIVIFMSDNGMTGGGSGRPDRVLGRDKLGRAMEFYNAGMKGLKGSPDEGGVRVPFFIRWPGHWEAGRDIDRIAAHLDLLPTLCAVAGAPLPEGQVEGRNLLPLLDQPDTDWTDRLLFTHVGRWPTGANPDDFQWKNFSVRSQRFRLVGRDQLFDMESDPAQTINVLDAHAEEADRMLSAYDQWWKDTRPLMVNESAPMSPVKPWHEAFRAQQKSEGIPKWAPAGG